MLGTEIEVISKINPFYPPNNPVRWILLLFPVTDEETEVQSKKIKLLKNAYLGK